MNEYQKQVEAFRHHYKTKYDVELDDVTLYFFIRVNEMQRDLKTDIANIPKVRFRNGWDYFWYGVGKNLLWMIIALCLLVVMLVIYNLFY